MHDAIEPIKYYPGIFDKYKNEDNLDAWDNFPELMWDLGFDMDSEESFHEFMKRCELALKEPKNEREEKRNRLYVLEHADRQVVGNELFSYWRYLTHWSYGYSKYDVAFLKRVIEILEDKYK